MVGQFLLVLMLVVLPLIERLTFIAAGCYIVLCARKYLGVSENPSFSERVKAALSAYRHPKGS